MFINAYSICCISMISSTFFINTTMYIDVIQRFTEKYLHI